MKSDHCAVFVDKGGGWHFSYLCVRTIDLLLSKVAVNI